MPSCSRIPTAIFRFRSLSSTLFDGFRFVEALFKRRQLFVQICQDSRDCGLFIFCRTRDQEFLHVSPQAGSFFPLPFIERPGSSFHLLIWNWFSSSPPSLCCPRLSQFSCFPADE